MTDTGSPKLLSVDDLSIAFETPSGPLAAVRQVSLSLEAGARTALVGESGSGKSTLALSILGLLPRSARVNGGSVSLDEQRLNWADDRAMSRIRGRRVGFIYQDPMGAFDPIRTIGEHLLEAIRRHAPSMTTRDARQRATALLEEVEIKDAAARLDDYPHQYSGGMRQRVMIAAALAGNPDLIVADEPTTALDVTTQAAVLGLFNRIVEARGTAILLVTHDLGVVSEFCDHVAVMYAGEVVHRGTVDAIFDAPLHPYTRALIEALPDPASDAPRLEAIDGAPPDPAALPIGCAFEPRCPLGHGTPICQTKRPRLRPIGSEEVACHLVEPRQVVS